MTPADHRLRMVLVVGARPNYMKVAPLYAALKGDPAFEPILVHTGQHYDQRMSKVFFDDLRLPKPDVYLGVGSGSHAVQTAQVMIGFEQVLLQYRPEWVIVVGDVNSTLGCALDASKLHIPVAHVEAGLRSGDRSMPEEINRIVTDSVADLLFTPSPDAGENLRREGISEQRISLVGNIMIDSLRRYEADAEQSQILQEIGVHPKRYGLLTLHRPSNVDDPRQLAEILDALEAIQKELPLVFPIHPRTRKMIAEHGLQTRVESMSNLRLIEPAGYLDFLKLQKHAAMVLTDSGGIQEETTALGIPCLTLRETTERPITVIQGTNILVGLDPRRIVAEARRVMQGEGKRGSIPKLWDGRTAERILAHFRRMAEASGRIQARVADAAGVPA
jgi:UDP-N-acetylglucosamine 2-epimerase (non-hydrolysing)